MTTRTKTQQQQQKRRTQADEMLIFPEEYWFLWYRNDENNNNNNGQGISAGASSSPSRSGCYDSKHAKHAKKFQKNLKQKSEKDSKSAKKFNRMARTIGEIQDGDNGNQNHHLHPAEYENQKKHTRGIANHFATESPAYVDPRPATPAPVHAGSSSNFDYGEYAYEYVYEYNNDEGYLCDESYNSAGSSSTFPPRVTDSSRTPAPIQSPWSDTYPNGPSSGGNSVDKVPPTQSPTWPKSNPNPTLPSPWNDGNENEVEVEIGDGNSMGSGSGNGGTQGGSANGNENQNPNGTTGTGQAAADSAFCQNIRDQNHDSVLAQQAAGTTGPSFLFSVPLSILHVSDLAPSDRVIEYLGALGIPVALAVAGCPEARRRSLQLQQQDDDVNNVVVEYSELETWQQIDASSPGEGPTTCSLREGDSTDGLSCGVFRSRVIVFLQDDGSGSIPRRADVEELLLGRITAAVWENGDLVTSNPGIQSLAVGDIEPLYIAQNGGSDGDGVGASSAESSNSAAAAGRGILLSKNATTIIGSVSACFGGLFIGMIFIVWWKNTSPYASTSSASFYKHKELEDDDAWIDEDPPYPSKDNRHSNNRDVRRNTTLETRASTASYSHYNNQDESSFVVNPRVGSNIYPDRSNADRLPQKLHHHQQRRPQRQQPRQKQRQQPQRLDRPKPQPPGVVHLPQDRFFPNHRSSKNRTPPDTGKHRGRPKRSLLDNDDGDEALFGAFQCPTNTLSTDPSSDDTDGNWGSCQPTFSYSPTSVAFGSPNDFSCGVMDSFSPQQVQQIEHCRDSAKPCASPTCPVCEQKRQSFSWGQNPNDDSTQYTDDTDPSREAWMRDVLPPSPERVPAFDPNRNWLCSDTVQL